MNISISIISISRAKNYIYNTVGSVMHDDPVPVQIFVGNRNLEYLNCYLRSPLVTLKTPDPLDKWWESKSLRVKSVWNYWRALSFSRDADYLLMMEDDVELARGWRDLIEKALPLAKETPITLYAPDSSDTRSVKFTFPREAYNKGEVITPYPMPKFYGTQAMIYSRATRKELATFFRKNLDNEDSRPIDWLVRDFFIQKGCGILCTAPVIAQHMGFETTGLAGRCHQSDCYISDVRKN